MVRKEWNGENKERELMEVPSEGWRVEEGDAGVWTDIYVYHTTDI
jgi:hypothetical protein